MSKSDELTLTVAGVALAGWTAVEVTRGIEQMPSTFVITATENSPVHRDAAGVREGSPCTVEIGGDKVITGYVDQVVASLSGGEHTVQLVGRGKCQDLVDCSAEWKGSQISGSSAQDIAAKLARPYGIGVKLLGPAGPVVPQFNINVTDTPADVLELVCRHAGLLYYEDADGDLVLAEQVPDDMATGFVEGQNVQAASVLKSMSQRYSLYRCALLGVDTSALFEYSEGLFYADAPDPVVARNRRLVIVAEGVVGGLDLARTRGLWEAARRSGRGRQVNVTVDSWRDGSGRLWTPNTLAPVELPTLKLTGAVYCLSTVTYRQDLSGGRTADVVLAPREAFAPSPIQIQPLVAGVE